MLSELFARLLSTSDDNFNDGNVTSPQDVPQQNSENDPEDGPRGAYEFIAFLLWYIFLVLCCVVPTCCAYRRRRLLEQHIQQQQANVSRLERSNMYIL